MPLICRSIQILFVAVSLQCVAFGQIRIDLIPTVEVSDSVLRLGQVGTLSGGELLDRRRIEQLDLAEVDLQKGSFEITNRQISARLLLAGYSEDAVELRGASTIRVSVSVPETPDARVLNLLLPAIANRLNVPDSDVQLRLSRPIASNVVPYIESKDFTLEPRLPQSIRIGMMTYRIAVQDNGRLVRTVPVSVETQVYQDVVVATRDLNVRDILGLVDLKLERRLISDRDDVAKLADLTGRSLRVAKEQGETIRMKDLLRVQRSRREVVIKNRDVIDLVARGSTLQIRVTGVIAMQAGAVGESIRVKNPYVADRRNEKTVVAEVVSAGLVEIRL